MNDKRVLTILLHPHVSEKGTLIGEKNNQLVFRVVDGATKPEIKQAIEFLFKVQVNSIQIVNVKGKIKKFRQKFGCRKNWKKAYVSLKDGQDINFAVTE